MSDLEPSADFVDRVMKDVHKLHQQKQERLKFAEKMMAALPTRLFLSVFAGGCGVWHLIRIYQTIGLPGICR